METTMTDRTASTVWEGSLAEGSGRTTLESSGLDTYDVSWPARTEEPGGRTSPEELFAAAHASCYSMALSGALAKADTPPEKLETSVTVSFGKTDDGFAVTAIAIRVRGTVPGADADAFAQAAQGAKDGCPISKLVAGGTADITLDAALA
jgi:osmotically inducible protein OsmC